MLDVPVLRPDRPLDSSPNGSKDGPNGGDAVLRESDLWLRPGEDLPRSQRVYFEVFGCQMNKLDAELAMGVLAEEGYRLTSNVREAGVVLFNTCAIREQAENRVFSKVGALRPLKREHPDLVIGVLGCSAQNHQEEIFKRHPHVGIVCGPGEFLRLPEWIAAARGNRQVAALSLDTEPRFERRSNLGPNPHQAYVSVMRGCDQACTFCVVPKTRGRELSRPVREIVDECRQLADTGVREVTLLGQTVNSYGKRLAKQRAIGLHHVLHELNKISGLERIRFITSHPKFMFPELIEAMAGLEKVCPYLHLPVQSGADSVLHRMLRTYTVEHYRRVVDSCRSVIPDFALATDLIIGFCGETDAEFAATLELVEEIRFQGSFVFRYSERAGTRAAALPDDVPEELKRERHQQVLRLQERISREIHATQVGSVTEVLVDGVSKQDATRLTGRNPRNQIVVFPGTLEDASVGQLVQVKITDHTAIVLVGECVGTEFEERVS